MKKYPEYKGLNLRQINEDVLAWWKENDTFTKSLQAREGATPWVFYEGPPSANGMPGIHHVMARTLKDIFCRYKTQQGFLVNRKAGWDTHGLPIELGVEKELGITKEDIGTKISVEDYNAACRKAVMRYTDVWNRLTEEMGYWVDMSDPYITYKPKYMESVWWLLKQIYTKNLLYKGYTIQPYSPKAGTGLSSHELNQPGTYQDVTDTTVVAMFKIISPPAPQRGVHVADVHDGNSPPLGELEGAGGAFFLAWTTTPWTLPSNTALCVGPKIDYVLVETFNQYTFEPIKVILAKALVDAQFAGKFFAASGDEDFLNYAANDKKIPFRVLLEFKGANLVGIRYEQLLKYALPNDNPENAFRVISGDFVTTEDGTGIVHIAPTFGADDAQVAKLAVPEVPPMLVKDENGNLVPLVNLQGKFRPEMAELAGKYVKNEYYDDGQAPERSVDVEIAISLKEENRAFKVEKYKHSYPNCWRTDKPILYYPLDSWFIKVTDVKERMVALNNTINWKPKSTGEGRFGNWLANANDWNLSRSRYWGIPLPIWRTDDGKEEICIGSVEELKSEIAKAIKAGVAEQDIFEKFEVGNLSDENYDTIDLHKNIVDKITLVSATGKPMKRESDLIDVWFDSGSMPYAQWHYPFSQLPQPSPPAPQRGVHEAPIPPLGGPEGGFFPADYIAEGVDQTRGWFYTLHAIATMVFDSVAYKNVISNGLVLDKNGQKMSKRLGNAVDPFSTMNMYGADALRWYMITNAQPWDNLKFDLEGVAEVQRKFFGTLYNTYSFFALYANIDGFRFAENEIPLAERPEIDRWILSELNTLIAEVQDGMDSFEPTRAYRPIQEFVNDKLSNWYVRLCRRRFWKGEYGPDKIAAYQTLYTCLETVAKISAPLAPFFMDRLYQDLNAVSGKNTEESVHLSFFPKSNAAIINNELEAKMQLAQKLSSMVLSLRKKEKIKVRQPLQKIIVPVLNDDFGDRLASVKELVLAEVNVKELEALDGSGNVFEKTIKPNFKTLGPKFGKKMKGISDEIAKLSQHDIAVFERIGEITLNVLGEEIAITTEDVDIHTQDVPGMLVASEDGVTVALDITISEELRLEGIARELVNRIQNLRKDSGFNVTDRINITLQNQPDLEKAVATFGEYIKAEVLGEGIVFAEKVEGVELSFDEIESSFSVAVI